MTVRLPSHPVLRLTDVAALRAQVRDWRAAGEGVALVPTMGALHEGHLSLVRQAQAGSRRVVVSIFVNPTQFGPNEDFSRYPRVLEADLALLAEIGADAAFLPDVGNHVPAGLLHHRDGGGADGGPVRALAPGHFAGVATVVTKLLLQCLPAGDLRRERIFSSSPGDPPRHPRPRHPGGDRGRADPARADGLALSSRNRYLSDEERRAAPAMHAVLQRVAEVVRGGAPTEPPWRRAGRRWRRRASRRCSTCR